MSSTETIKTKQEDELKKAIYFGQKAQQKEENFGKIELKYKDKNVTQFVLNWLDENKVRTPTTILDFFEELNNYVDIITKEKKEEREKLLKRKLSSGNKYNDYINDRRKLFEEIIDDQDQRMEDEWIPPEFDTLIASDIIYAREKIKKESKKVRQILRGIQVKSRHYNTNQRMNIYEKLRGIIFSILIIQFRTLEILIKFEEGSDMNRLLELLEWDINTLELSRFSLDEYKDSLLEKVWNKKWTDAFTEETRELIELFK